ncbi:MAG: helix-turn-helix transcriptional regulator, partial [Bacteroidetes bacterium]|nr:helix-turn-helix transcriptional regulator [Bacteroidota bacterium]
FIKHHRITQNKTQQEIADNAGINRTTLSSLENGGIVTISTLIQVLRVLDLLYIMEVFEVKEQISPIELAKLEQRKRQRASNKKGNNQPKSDW